MPYVFLLMRFVMICGLASVAYMALAVLAMESMRLVSGNEPGNAEKLLANLLALLLGAAIAFWGMRRFGGASRAASRRGSVVALLRWFAVVTGALAVHELVLLALLHWAPWSWVLCEAMALGAAGTAAFLASRRWVFA